MISLVISSLTARVREQAEAAMLREKQTSALYNLEPGSDLRHRFATTSPSIIISQISQAFDREVAIFLP